MRTNYILERLWDTQGLRASPKILIIIGAACTLIYALTKISFGSIATASSVVFAVIGLWCCYRYGDHLRRSPPFIFILLAITIQLLSWIASQVLHPELARDLPKIELLTRIFLFVPIAWWLGSSIKNTFIFWSAAAIGIATSPWLIGGGFKEISDGLSGARVDFSISNAQHPSLLFGTLLIGLLCFCSRLWRSKKGFFSFFLFWIPCIILCLVIIVITQTRATWLGLIITGCVAGLLFFLNHLSSTHKRGKGRLIFITLLLSTLALTVPTFFDGIIAKRISAEKATVNAFMEGQIDNIPYSSIGIRIHTWRAGIEHFRKRPIFGWGANGKRIAIEESTWLPEDVRKGFGHLHNTFLELLVNYGVLGLAFYFSLIGWTLRESYRARKRNDMPNDIFIFFVLFLVFWNIVNFFESFLMFWTGAFTFNVVLAGILTHTWKNPIASYNKK